MSKEWIESNSRHPDNCDEYNVIFADVVEAHLARIESQNAQLQAQVDRVRNFPTILRKMWSGGEVGRWIEKSIEGDINAKK